jgi:virginiamycin B lyase
MTTSGVVTTYSSATIDDATSIVVGPDGALWFANVDGNSIGQITTSGVVTNYTGTGISNPSSIAVGSGGALWFTTRATTRSAGSPPPVS